jgi:predicted transglutaminase-like cysteine proteinase
MRQSIKAMIGVCGVFVGLQAAQAGFVGLPRSLGIVASRISFETPVLPPVAFTQFCIRYADECKPRRMAFRGGAAHIDAVRWQDLNMVNKSVNRAIAPEPNTGGVGAEKWLIGPSAGDCNDYAVTKRSELAKRGWPLRSLLLSEVVTASGEHHLVLVVRTTAGDLVLDNLSYAIKPWSKTPYRWVRVQTPANPNAWSSVGERSV